MKKSLCRLVGKEKILVEDFEKYKKIVKKPKFYCQRCGRVAKKEKYLCKPTEL